MRRRSRDNKKSPFISSLSTELENLKSSQNERNVYESGSEEGADPAMLCSFARCPNPSAPGYAWCSEAHSTAGVGAVANRPCAFRGCSEAAFFPFAYCSAPHRDNDGAPAVLTCARCSQPPFLGLDICSLAHASAAPPCSKCARPAAAGSPFCSKSCATLCRGQGCRNAAAAAAASSSGAAAFCSVKCSGRAPCVVCGGVVDKGLSVCSTACAKSQRAKVSPGLGIALLASQSAQFVSVRDQFLSKWSTAPRPQVEKIYVVNVSQSLLDRYNAYKEGVISRSGSRPSVQKGFGAGGPGNEQRRFHGTSVKCGFKKDAMCSNGKCAMCCIMRDGFKLAKANSAGYYGGGVYSSSTSSKSDVYNKDSKDKCGKG